MTTPARTLTLFALGLAGLVVAGPAQPASAELVMKILVVNPSETQTKEFDVRNPLPPEVKPEHVLNADGLKVDYDSQASTYVLVGKITLKPKESVTKRIVLEDVWIIAPERFSGLRRELGEIQGKLKGTPYEIEGRLLGQAVEQRVTDVERSQDEPFLQPMQHITRYRENLKTLQMAQTDLVSLRQLMVMAALRPARDEPQAAAAPGPAGESPLSEEAGERGGLSTAATWRLIFIIMGLLGAVSLSFFLVWQRQLKLQLAKQAKQHPGDPLEPSVTGDNGGSATHRAGEAPPAPSPRVPGAP